MSVEPGRHPRWRAQPITQ